MDIRNLKIFKVISSIILFTFCVLLLRDYSYATSINPTIPTLSEIRKNAGEQYTRSFVYLGVNEEVAIENNANKFINTISNAYEEHKKEINETFTERQNEVNSNKAANINRIQKEYNKDKSNLYNNFVNQRAKYDSEYQAKRSDTISMYDKDIQEAKQILRRYQASSGRLDAADKNSAGASGVKKDISKANKKASKFGGRVNGADTSGIKIDNSYGPKIRKMQAKIASLEENKAKSLQGLETRRNYYLQSSESNYRQDLDNLDMRTNGYIEELENLTNERLLALEIKKEEGIEDLYNNSMSEINKYLFNENDGILYKAYDWDEKSIMRDLKVSSEGNKSIKTQDREGGYIGDLKKYNAIQETLQSNKALNYLNTAEKYLKSGANNGLDIAKKYVEEASMLGKQVTIVEPKKETGEKKISNKEVEIGYEDKVGKKGAEIVEGQDSSSKTVVPLENLKSKKNTLKEHIDKESEGIKEGQNKSTDVAVNQMDEKNKSDMEYQKDLTLEQIQDLVNFVNQIEYYLNLAWPEGAVSGHNYAQDEVEKAEKMVEEAEDDLTGAVIALSLTLGLGLVSLIFSISNLVAATATLGMASALVWSCPCVWAAVIVTMGILIALTIVNALLTVAGMVVAILYYVSCQNELKAALKAKQKADAKASAYSNALYGIVQNESESDEDFQKRKEASDTSYTRYLKAQYDYQRALSEFRATFYDAFKGFFPGPLMIKKVREGIKKIHDLIKNRKLSELSEKDLKKLQDLLYKYGFVKASKNLKLRMAMNNLSDKFDKYQRALKELEEDQTKVQYKDPETGEISEITMAEAYKQFNFWSNVAAYLQEKIEYLYANQDNKTKIWIALNNATADVLGGYRVEKRYDKETGAYLGVGYVYTKGAFGIAMDAILKVVKNIMHFIVTKFTSNENVIKTAEFISQLYVKTVVLYFFETAKSFITPIFGGVQQIQQLEAAFSQGGVKDVFATIGGGMLGTVTDTVGGLLGMKQGWLVSFMKGESFMKSVGWDKIKDYGTFLDTYLENYDPMKALKLIAQMAIGRMDSAKAKGQSLGAMDAIKDTAKVTGGYFSKIGSMFARGGAYIALGVAMIVLLPLALPVLLLTDLVLTVVSGIIDKGKDIYTTAKDAYESEDGFWASVGNSTFVESVGNVMKNSGKMVANVATGVFSKVSEALGGGIIGGILGGIAAGVATLATIPLVGIYATFGVMSAIMGTDNGNESTTYNITTQLENVLANGGILSAIGTMAKSIGKFAANAFMDLDVDALGVMSAAQAISSIAQGVRQLTENIQTLGFLVVSAMTGNWALAALAVPVKIFDNWYNRTIQGVAKQKKDNALSALKNSFKDGELELSTLDISTDSQVAAILGMVDVNDGGYVTIDGKQVFMNKLHLEEYIASGGNISEIGVSINGEIKTFNLSNFSDNLRQSVISQMSTSRLSLMADSLSKKQRNEKNGKMQEILQSTKDLISKQMISRTSNDMLNALNSISNDPDTNIEMKEINKKYESKGLTEELREQAALGDKNAIKKYNSILEDIGKEEITIGDVTMTVRQLSIMTGHDFSEEILSDMSLGRNNINKTISVALKQPKIQTTVQETITFRNVKQNEIANLHNNVEKIKESVEEFIDEDLEEKKIRLKELNDANDKETAEIEKLEKEKRVVEDKDYREFFDDDDNTRIAELKKRISDLDTDINNDETEIGNITKKIKVSETEYLDIENKNKLLKSQNDELDVDIEGLKGELTKLKKNLKDLNEDNLGIEKEKSRLRAEIKNDNDEYEGLDAHITKLNKEKADFEDMINTDQNNINKNKEEIENLKQKQEALDEEYEGEMNKYNNKKNDLENEKKQYEASQENLKLEQKALHEDLKDIEAKITEKKSELRKEYEETHKPPTKDSYIKIATNIFKRMKEITGVSRKTMDLRDEISDYMKNYIGSDLVKIGTPPVRDSLGAMTVKKFLENKDDIIEQLFGKDASPETAPFVQRMFNKANKDYQKGLNAFVSEGVVELENNKVKIDNEINIKEGEISSLNKNIDNVNKNINSLKKPPIKDLGYGKKIIDLENENIKLNKNIDSNRNKIDKNNQTIISNKTKMSSLADNINIKKNKLDGLNTLDDSGIVRKINDIEALLELKNDQKITNQKSINENTDTINKIKTIIENDEDSINKKRNNIIKSQKEKLDSEAELNSFGPGKKLKRIQELEDQIKAKKESDSYKNYRARKGSLETEIEDLRQGKAKLKDSSITVDEFYNLAKKYKDSKLAATGDDSNINVKNEIFKENFEALESNLSGDFKDKQKITLEFVDNAGGERAEIYYREKIRELMFMRGDANFFSKERKDLSEIIDKTELAVANFEIHRLLKVKNELKMQNDTEENNSEALKNELKKNNNTKSVDNIKDLDKESKENLQKINKDRLKLEQESKKILENVVGKEKKGIKAEDLDFTELGTKNLSKVQDYLKIEKSLNNLYGDEIAIMAEKNKVYMKELFKNESDKALKNVEIYIESSEDKDVSLLKNNLKNFQDSATSELTSLLKNELKDVEGVKDFAFLLVDDVQTKIKNHTLKDEDVEDLAKTILDKGGSEETVSNVKLIVKTVKDLDNIAENFGNVADNTKKIDAIKKYKQDMNDLVEKSDSTINLVKSKINAKIDQNLNESLNDIERENSYLLTQKYKLKKGVGETIEIDINGEKEQKTLAQIEQMINKNNEEKENLIKNANSQKTKYAISFTNRQYEVLRTVNHNVLNEFVSGYEEAAQNGISLKNFNTKKGEGRETGVIIRRSVLSKIENGEIELSSYAIEHNGKKLSLSHSSLKDLVKENDFQGSYSKEMLTNIIKREKLNEKRIKLAKENLINITEGGKDTEKSLEIKTSRSFTPIKDAILASNKEINKKKFLEILNEELDKNSGTSLGDKIKGIFPMTDIGKKKDAIQELIKIIEKVDKDTFTSQDFEIDKDGRNVLGNAIQKLGMYSGQSAINMLKAAGYDIDKNFETKFVSNFKTKEVFNRTGILKENQEMLRQDVSNDLRNELKVLTIKQNISKLDLDNDIDSLDITKMNKKSDKIFDNISENIIEKNNDNLGKVCKKLVDGLSEDKQAEYKEIIGADNKLNKEKARTLLTNLSMKEFEKALADTSNLDDASRDSLKKTFGIVKELDYKKEALSMPSLVENMMKETNADMAVLNTTVRNKINPILAEDTKELEDSYNMFKNIPEDKRTQEQKNIILKHENIVMAKKLDYCLNKLKEADRTFGTIDIDTDVMDTIKNIIKNGKPFSQQSELNKMYLSKGLQLLTSNLNGLEGDNIYDKDGKVRYTRSGIRDLTNNVNKFVNQELEDNKVRFFKKLDQMIEEPMANIQKAMVENIINTKNKGNTITYKFNNKELTINRNDEQAVRTFIKTASYDDIENNLGSDLNSDKILSAAFPGYKPGTNLTSTQAEIMRAITLKMAEGHHPIENGKFSARETSFADVSMGQSQNQLLMMAANDAGYIAALGMGGGKTRVYPLVIASQMMTGKAGTAEILVSARQEVTNMLGTDEKGNISGGGNTAIMKRFFGVDMQNGVKPEGVNDNEYLVKKLNNATNKTIFVFDLETRGHLAHEIREDKRLNKLNDIGTVAIDEADALALRQQSFINASKKAASHGEKYQVIKTLEIYTKVIDDMKKKDPLIESKVFKNENGINSMNAQVLDNMLEEMKKDKALTNMLYNPAGVTTLEDDKMKGQFQYTIEQVLRAKQELKNGDTVGGYKSDSVSGVQFGVQDGVSINSVATQVIDSYLKKGGNMDQFSLKNFENTMDIKSLDEFKAEVSVTTVEASTQEILTKNQGVKLNVFGGSGTVYGAKTISKAVSAPVLEISEGTFTDYSYKTAIVGDKTTSDMASDFMNNKKSEANWGKLAIQDHKNIRKNLMKTLENRVQGDEEAIKFLDKVSAITKKTDRVSTAEFASDYGKEGEIIDKVFNKEGETGYRSLGELIRTGKVKYQDDGFHEVTQKGEIGRLVDVSMMDILKSRTAVKAMLNDNLEAAENLVNKLETKKIYVIDNYTNADNVSPLAKKVSENEYSVFATNKAGRGMDFKGKMELLVLDAEKISKNDLLQILGRVGRGSSKDTFSRTVAVDVSSMKKRFESSKQQIEAKLKDLDKSEFYKNALKAKEGDRTIKQQKIIQEYNELKTEASRYGSYIEDIENGDVRKSVSEMIQDNSVVLANEKANASALYQISEGVRTALIKLPLETMIKKATGKDKLKLELIRDEFLRKAKGQEADLYRQEDGEYKSGMDTFKKSLKSTLDLSEQVYGMLSSDKQKYKVTRRMMLGINDGIEDKNLLAELKYRRKDIEGTKKTLDSILKTDWNELMLDVEERVEKSGIYTMAQINSSQSLGAASTVLDTALYIAKDISYTKKMMKDEDLVQNVKITNTALTGNQNKGVFKFNTNDETLIAHKLETMKKDNWKFELNNDKYKVSQIILTPKQYNRIQKSPLVKKIVDEASQNKNLKIMVASSENMIKNNNVFSYEDFGTKKVDKKVDFYQNMKDKKIVNFGSNFEDKAKDKTAKELFRKRIQDKNLGIKEEDWQSGDVVINVDAKRWEELSKSEKKDFTEKFKNKIAEIKDKKADANITLAISSDKTNTTISKDLQTLNKVQNVFERKELFLQRQKLIKEKMYEERNEKTANLLKTRDEIKSINADILKQKQEIETLEKEKEIFENKSKEKELINYTKQNYADILKTKDLTKEKELILLTINRKIKSRKISFKEKGLKEEDKNSIENMNKFSSISDIQKEIDFNRDNLVNLNRIIKTSKDNIIRLSKMEIDEMDHSKTANKIKQEVLSLTNNLSKIESKLNLSEDISAKISYSIDKIKKEMLNSNLLGQIKLKAGKEEEIISKGTRKELNNLREELNEISRNLVSIEEIDNQINEFKKETLKTLNIENNENIKNQKAEMEEKIETLKQDLKNNEEKLKSKNEELDIQYNNIQDINNKFNKEANELYLNSLKYDITIASKEIDKKILDGEKIKEDDKLDLKKDTTKLETITDNEIAKLILEKTALEKELDKDTSKITLYEKEKEKYKELSSDVNLEEVAKSQILSLNNKIKAIRQKNANKIDRMYELTAILDSKNFDNYFKEKKEELENVKDETEKEWKEERIDKLDKINQAFIDEKKGEFSKISEERKKYIDSKLNQKYLDNLNKLFSLDNYDYVVMESVEDIEKVIKETEGEKDELLQTIKNAVGSSAILDMSKEDLGSFESEDRTEKVLISSESGLISESEDSKDVSLNDISLIDEEKSITKDQLKEIYNNDKDAFYEKVMQNLKTNEYKTFEYAKAKDTFGKLNSLDEKIAILTERQSILRAMNPDNLSDFILSDYLEENYVDEEKGAEDYKYLKAQEIGNVILSTDEKVLKEYNKFDNERRKNLFAIEKEGFENSLGFSYRFKNFFKGIFDKMSDWIKYHFNRIKNGFVMPKIKADSFIGFLYNLWAIISPLFSAIVIVILALLYVPAIILGGVASFVLALFNPNIESKGGVKVLEQAWAVIWRVATLFIPSLIQMLVKKIRYQNIFNNNKKQTLDFSGTIFKEAKRSLKAKKITLDEYKDLIAMEIEQKLLDEYIRNKEEDRKETIYEIVVSSQKTRENELAIRDGIKAFNEKASSLVDDHKNILPNIVVRDTKGNIVDVYSNKYINLKGEEETNDYKNAGILLSRNEEIEKVLLNNKNAVNDPMQEMLRSLNLGGGVKNITLSKAGFKKQKEELQEKISSIKTEPLIINLDNVEEKNINELTSDVFREVLESGKITTNIVFTKNGRFFGATEKRVSDAVKSWNNFENTLGIKKLTRKNIYKNININSTMIGSNLETNYMTESIDTKAIKDDTKYEKGKSAYLDPIVIDEDGTQKELYKIEIGEKVKISLNKDALDLWNIGENRQKFMYRLRQISNQYKDLQKEIEIELPEIEEGEKLKILSEEKIRLKKENDAKTGREAIKKTCESFIDEHKEEETRRFWLHNDKGNILRVNNVNLFGTFVDSFDIKEVLLIPGYVLTDEVVFKNWLSQKLQAEGIRRDNEQIILGLDKELILPRNILSILDKYFQNENIKIINRRGEEIRLPEISKTKQISKEESKGKIEINNPRMNQNIFDSIESMESIELVQITDDFAKDSESINALMTALHRKGYNGDINILGYNNEIVKLWQTQVFEKGAIIREFDNTKEFDEFLEVAKTQDLSKFPFVFNINSRDELSLKKLNNLIKNKHLGNVTLLMRGEILATNDANILKGEEKFEKMRDKSIKKLSDSKIKNEDIKDIESILGTKDGNEEALKKDFCIITDKLNKENKAKLEEEKEKKEPDYTLESEKITIFTAKNIPVYRGNILFNMKGARDYIKDLENLYNKENLTDEDIVKISTQVTKAVQTYGINFALESHKKMAEKAKADKSITKFLDIAA